MSSSLEAMKQQMQAALSATRRSRLRREGSLSGLPKMEHTEDTIPNTLMSSHNISVNLGTENGSDGALHQLPRKVSFNIGALGHRRSSNSTDNSSVGEIPQMESTSYLAISLLDASSKALRQVVGTHLKDILVNQSHMLETGEVDIASVRPIKATKSDVDALVKLAQSPNMVIRMTACDLIASQTDSLPRGKSGVKNILEKTSLILDRAVEEQNDKAMMFALHVGQAIAKEGETWAKRMVTDAGWDGKLRNLLLSLENIDILLVVLDVCAEFARCSSTEVYLDACVRVLQRFPNDRVLLRRCCAVLSKNLPAVADESVLIQFLNAASQAAEDGDFQLTSDALKVVRAKSQAQAQKLTQLFEDCDVMNTINALYRSQTFGSKLECALFIEALVKELGSDIDSKVHLCESGIIIRLIRLASPSAGTSDDGHELAYLSAITALTELAAVDRIGARIVLAGGLGPLFSHANSNRNTRTEAKKALKALGVSNLGTVVDSWIKAAKDTKAESAEEPLEKIMLPDGTRLLLQAPPPNFFAEVVNDPKAVLGRGAFSVVYRATLSNGRVVAVKRLTKAAAADPGFAEEIRVLARVPAHPNIVGLVGVYLNESECLIISELGGPTLSSVLANGKPRLEWKSRLSILIGVADAMRHLHGLDPCILHLDLKASNVLLVGPEQIPKLCDFGLAVELKEGFEFLLPGEHGTIQYMAPECMRESDVELAKGFDTGADIYSFSMVMWEVAHPGRIPWQGEDFETSESIDITTAIRSAVLAGRRPQCEGMESWPAGYYTLMMRCWSKHAEDRPRFLANFFEDESTTKSGQMNQTVGSILRKMFWEFKKQ